jgi:acetyl/propionyl-CoA carboxylase alpha subunit
VAVKVKRPSDSHEFEVELISREGAKLRARIDGREVEARVEPLFDGTTIVTLKGRRLRVAVRRRRESILVATGPAAFEFRAIEERAARAAHGLVTPEVTAPMPGKVLKVMVHAGERVEAGRPLVVMEAMKMETTLYAEGAAIVKRTAVAPGDAVDHGAVLIELSPVSRPSSPASGGQDS